MFYCPVAVNHQLFEWFPSLIRPFITTFENCANRFIPLDIWHTDLSRKKRPVQSAQGFPVIVIPICIAIRNRRQSAVDDGKR